MLKTKWIPTRIIHERPRPEVREPEAPTRTRALRVLRVLVGIYLSIVWDRFRGRGDPASHGLRIRAAFESLGGLWIKVGQLVSMRTDIFDPELCGVIGQMRDEGCGFPYRFAEQAIEEDLGEPVDRLFSEFDPAPFGASSTGQLHRAVLRSNGKEVAVKVQRPYVEEFLNLDSRIIRILSLLANTLKLIPGFRWPEFFHELQHKLNQELDFRFEASNLRRMRKNLKKHKKVYCPYVYKKHAGRRVLVMEFTRGVLMADVIDLAQTDPDAARLWYAENNIDPHKVAERLYASQLRQRFIDNLFHKNLDPYNIVLLRGGRICLINFGTLGRLDDDMQTRFKELQEALSFAEFAKFIDVFFLIPPDLPVIDLEQVRTELMRALRAWELRTRTKRMSFAEKSMVGLFAEMALIVTRYRIPLPWAFLQFNRSSLTLDLSLRALHPNMNYWKVSRRYHRRAEKEVNRSALRTLRKNFDLAEAVTGLSESLHRTREQGLYRLEWVRRRARSFQAIPTKLAYALLAFLDFTGLLFDAGVILSIGLYVHQYHRTPLIPDGLAALYDTLPMISEPAWLVIGVTGATLYVQMARIRARFREPDVELPGRRH